MRSGSRVASNPSAFLVRRTCLSPQPEALAECRREIRLPIVTGEELYTKAEFRPVFEKRAADIINPDVRNCGGYSNSKKLPRWPNPILSPFLRITTTAPPLVWPATPAGCSYHAELSHYRILCEFRSTCSRRRRLVPFQVDHGYIALPTTPGLGIELRQEVLARYPCRTSLRGSSHSSR